MRLRSSQFVFLLLLVCSLQIREDHAARLIADAVAGRTILPAQAAEAASSPVEPIERLARPMPALALPPQALAAHRIAWTVRPPALESAAVISFSGFLRA